MSLYRVYVVQNAEGKFYIGLSEDVRRRIGQHNDGGSRWTKGRGPWARVWKSKKLSLGGARKLENSLKGQKGGSGFFRLISLAPRGGA
jgi:putative endonuclease